MGKEQRPAFGGKPLFDMIQAVRLNLFLLLLYSLLLLWSAVSMVLIVSFANISWPLALALSCAIVTFLVHFGILATGLVLVRGFEPYPLKPIGLYQFVDFGLGSMSVLMVLSYSFNSRSSTVPLIGTFLLFMCLALTVQKVYIVTRSLLSNERDRVTGEII